MDIHVKELNLMLQDILPASKTYEIIEKYSIEELLAYTNVIDKAESIINENIWTYSNNISYEIKNIKNAINIFKNLQIKIFGLLNEVLSNYDLSCLMFKDIMMKRYDWFDNEIYQKVIQKFLKDVGNSDFIVVQPNPISLLENHPFTNKENVVDDLIALSLLMYNSNLLF